MITIDGSITINCKREKLIGSLEDLENIYTKYCPEEHVLCKYVKGNPTKHNSIIKFQEYVGGKLQKMKYKVLVIKDNEKYKFKGCFPRSLLNIHILFDIEENDGTTTFKRSIRFGYGTDKHPLDNFFLKVIGENYYNEMVVHNLEDLKLLKKYIEAN